MIWTKDTIRQLITHFSLKEMKKPFQGLAALYSPTNADLKDDIGLDSIKIMELAAQVNAFFHLYEQGSPPYLLSYRLMDEWAYIVHEIVQVSPSVLSFQTSGTSGTSKIVTHSSSFLNREVTLFSNRFKEVTHIIPFVPSFSIYGYLFTIALPQVLSATILYPSEIKWQLLPPTALIIATPLHLQLLISSMPILSNGCYRVTATATLYDDVFKAVHAKNIRLTEIYGSIETAGVGWRDHREYDFKLFPYWSFSGTEGRYSLEDKENKANYSLMDDITLLDNNQFKILGRKDKQVNVAGILVNVDKVREKIIALPNIEQCKITAKQVNQTLVLEASIHLIIDNQNERSIF